jgi:transcriptional regulator
MHPNSKFHIGSRDEMVALVRAEGFGVLTVQTEAGLRGVHVPVLLDGDRLRFHVSRGNLVHQALVNGAPALFVATGPHAYVSPDWYGLPDRVATWSYLSVELNGPVRTLGEDALITLLDEMSAEHEQRLLPKPPWTRHQMSPGRFEGLLKAIAGFEMHIADWRGTAKIDQDKPVEVRERIAEHLLHRGEEAMAALYASPWPSHGEGDQAKPGGGVTGAGPGKLPLHHRTGGPPPPAPRGQEQG